MPERYLDQLFSLKNGWDYLTLTDSIKLPFIVPSHTCCSSPLNVVCLVGDDRERTSRCSIGRFWSFS